MDITEMCIRDRYSSLLCPVTKRFVLSVHIASVILLKFSESRITLGRKMCIRDSRKTAQALKDIHGISISHQQVANYCKTASACIKPFVDNYDYKKMCIRDRWCVCDEESA